MGSPKRKSNGGIYKWELVGYRVIAADAPSPHRGGVAVLYCKADNFSLGALRLHGPNVVSFHMALGGEMWNVMGFYTALDNASNIESIILSVIQSPKGATLLITRYYNMGLSKPDGNVWDK